MKDAPKPPAHQDKIEPKIQKNVEGWITYFANLSPRIKLIRNTDSEFDIDKLHQIARDVIEHMDENQTILFPTKENVAFVILVDSNKFGPEPVYWGMDTYLFCSGNCAFSLSHFTQDSDSLDDEGERWEYFDTYSLRDYSEDCLFWKYIAKIIRYRIKEIEQKVPDPPK